jgi:hypothetical protein
MREWFAVIILTLVFLIAVPVYIIRDRQRGP